MTSRAGNWSLGWDWSTVLSESTVADQRWVLSAMQKHGPALVRLLWRILGNEQDVCDAYQDTFVQLAHRHPGRKPHHIKAFVFRTAGNVALSMLRRRQRHRRACQVVAHRAQRDEPIGADDELDARQLRQKLQDHITQLPENYRDAVLLRDLAEMPYGEVARVLGVSTATARVYRHRGIRLLTAWMSREDGDRR